MSRDKLVELDREALIELILQQAQQIASLQSEIEVLRKKLERGKKPPTNSGNSSQPPSRDWKGNFAEQQQTIADHNERFKAFAAVYEEMKRTIANNEKFQLRIQQDQKQVAELQRLAEERQKKEFESYMADNEKRWKKQILEWQFRWDQQDKFNSRVNDRFPQVVDQLDHHDELMQFFWRVFETQSGNQLLSAQNWLSEIQKFADQREEFLKKYEEKTFRGS